MRVLLLSTYELGAQPIGLAAPATALRAAGHEVRCRDLAVEDWTIEEAAWAEALACSVPMHTALRLGRAAIDAMRDVRPDLPVAYHGLYAPVAATAGMLGDGDVALAGDSDGLLVAWLDELRLDVANTSAVRVEIGKANRESRGGALDRHGLPGLEHYARLLVGEERRLVGTLAASSGCNHRCRHCPVPVLYDGRSRPTPEGAVLEEAASLVAAGAEHLRFADPDFFNRPAHALRVARALHDAFPTVTFDATIKVSHLLRFERELTTLAECGLAFVVSAFESTSELILERLAKGHSAADAGRAVELGRHIGFEIRPSFLPFTPWTTPDDVVTLFDFVAEHDLVWNVDPVQFSIRLLLPPGSLLLERPDPQLAATLEGFDADSLGTAWHATDPLLDELQRALAEVAEACEAAEVDPDEAYTALRATVHGALGRPDRGRPAARSPLGPPGATRPRLSEAWFCCAEPTRLQLEGIAARR